MKQVEIVDQTWEWAGEVLHGLLAGPEDGRPILLLHGAAFTSRTWQDSGTLAWLVGRGHRVIALDLPGFGRSKAVVADPDDFLARFLDVLDIAPCVVVAPSMSGRFAFPLVLDRPERVAGFVPIAPAGIDVAIGRLPSSPVPALVLWGGADQVFPCQRAEDLQRAIPGSALHLFSGARHPCYLDAPDEFHRVLADWVEELEPPALRADDPAGNTR
jgi:abhydrolase domain-containing protein 14